jgi:hypothetical protein
MSHRKTPIKPNGHAGPHDRTNGSGDPDPVGVNGHAPASTERGGIPVHGDQAASDDASGVSVANAAVSSTAAGTARQANAEAAPPPSDGEMHEATGKNTKSAGKSKNVPPGEAPLPATADEFVDEIHSRIDLFKVWQDLLRSKDIKIKQRAVERLTDLRYKTGSSQAEDPQQIIFDMPRPNRD